MMFLDTNIVVDALRRFPPAVTYLETAEQQGTLSLSKPSQMELITKRLSEKCGLR
jgi:hypothetical protein